MMLERIYVCTSKQGNLYRIYKLQTGDREKQTIFDAFSRDINNKISNETSMERYNRTALIQDIPYTIKFDDILETSYLNYFKIEIEDLLNNMPENVIQFRRFGKLEGEVKNFADNEGIKFLIVQDETSLYFLSISNNTVIKNKPVVSLSITQDTTVVNVPKGIQVPPAVTARLRREDKKLFVYDVNRFESMLTLNENLKAKSHEVINKFKKGDYTISDQRYHVIGLDNKDVINELFRSARAVRRLAKYRIEESEYSIEQIKSAVNKLDKTIRVNFDEDNRTIEVTSSSSKTFVGIIHNSIVQRLISGDIEITI